MEQTTPSPEKIQQLFDVALLVCGPIYSLPLDGYRWKMLGVSGSLSCASN